MYLPDLLQNLYLTRVVLALRVLGLLGDEAQILIIYDDMTDASLAY